MEKRIINSSLEELVQAITDQIHSLLKPILQQPKDPDCEDIMTREDVAKLLSISLPTLHNYVNAGILECIRIAGSRRVYFNRCAVYKLLNSTKGRK